MFFWQRKSAAVGELTKLFEAAAIGRDDCAHVAVDVQKIYAQESIARRIARHITPAFRTAGIPTYWVHFSSQVDKNDMPAGEYGFCEVVPEPGEEIIEKTQISAIRGSDIGNRLEKNHIRLLAITGFTFCVCIQSTVRDARDAGFQVVVLTDGVDMTKGDADIQARLAEKGVIFTSSGNFMAALRTAEGPSIRPPS